MKSVFRNLFLALLLPRAQKVLKKAKTVIGVTGSVGKTSTRMAIATVLSERWRVQTSPQNFNTPIGLLLSILDVEESGKGIFSWIKILLKTLFRPLPNPQILVLEFGVDAPGDMLELLRICTPYTAVLTPIALAHTAEGQFSHVTAIRTEKTLLAIAATKVVANAFDTETADFLRRTMPEKTEFFGEGLDNVLEVREITTEKTGISFLAGSDRYSAPVFGSFQAQIFAPAILLGMQNGLSPTQIQRGIQGFLLPPGRGRIFSAQKNATIWDFSYNSSPVAVHAVLASLSEMKGFSRKIAILGTMNELGNISEREHEELGKKAGEYADEIIFVGNFAQDFARGLSEKRPLLICQNAKEAGKILQDKISEGDLLLFKGSQNGVFLEEAIRMILDNPEDASKLCRQSEEWKKKKAALFS